MIARPCAGCGDVIASGSRCPDCRPTRADTPPRTHVAYANLARWKRLSQKLRKAQPWCTWCGITTHLQVDHIIPDSVAPELAYAEENLRVLDAVCNNQRQANYTRQEAQHVLTRLEASYRRRPTATGRHRIQVARRALTDLGGCPSGSAAPTAGKAQGAMNLTGVNSV